MPSEALIIGAGVSGLATAYFLAERGIRAHIIEKEDRLGGLIRTDLVEGCRLEAGPDSFISIKPSVANLASRIPSLCDKIIGSNDTSRRVFIVRNGELIELPAGMVMMAPSQWKPALASRLFSARTKLRFLEETLQRPRKRASDISAAQLVTDHFGEEVLRYVAAPLLSGVYGGDASQLSAKCVFPRFLEYERTRGSLIQGVRRERRGRKPSPGLFLSFVGGMQSLTDALAQEVQTSVTISNAEAISVEKNADHWRVRSTAGESCASTVILACPAYTAAGLLHSSAPALSRELAQITYSSAILVTLLYDERHFSHPLDGFGFLVPAHERTTIAAATWINTKFPSRVASGSVALRAFIVDPEAHRLADSTDEELAALAQSDLKRLMKFDAPPRLHIVNRWPRSMPQYVVGHAERMDRIRGLTSALSGLQLVGNYLSGVGIPDCIRLAEETAKNLPASQPVLTTKF